MTGETGETTGRRRPRLRRWVPTKGGGKAVPGPSRTLLGLTAVGLGLAGLALLARQKPAEPGPVVRREGGPLLDASGRPVRLTGGPGTKATVLVFLGNPCPASDAVAPEVRRLAAAYAPRGVAFRGVLVGPDARPGSAARYRFDFPVVPDPDHDLADPSGVTVTPEAVVLDPDGAVVYRGRVVDREPGKAPLRAAIDAAVAGRPPAVAEARAVGTPLPRVRVAGPGERVTYAKHVAPILARRCAGCHRPGDVGPFPLLTYRDAARRAAFLAGEAADRRMPPWKPRRGFGEFLDEARLTPRELATLAAWAEAGAPEGDPADLPPAPPAGAADAGWQLGKPDLVLEVPEPYPVGPGDDLFRAFALPLTMAQARGIAAVEFRPGNRRVVHHARFHVDPGPGARRRDEADPGPGFTTAGGNDLPIPSVGGWIPGGTPRRFPEGVGFTLGPGWDFVLLVHYHGTGKPEVDRSRVGLYFARTPAVRPMAGVPLSTDKIDIPPGEARHRIELEATLPADVRAYNVTPHGHYLLREMKLWATLPDGDTRRLLWIDDWDFSWQGVYHFAEPVALPKGTTLHVAATYDNSAGNPVNPNHPPVRVRYGTAATDEMLGCHLQVLSDRPEDDAVVRKKWPFSL